MTAGKLLSLSAALVVVMLLTGCVMTEKYEAEKARALNFQRLLAQEEKRTGDLDSELKRVKRESVDLEARNRELSAQVQAVREQLQRIQEEAAAMRDAAMLKEQEALSKPRKSVIKPKRQDKNVLGEEPRQMMEPLPPASTPESSAMSAESGSPRYHQVKPGETLYRLSRQYGVDVATLKSWNNLGGNQLEVGQKLIVGHQ
ncbi:MAG: LysM peptidoglycan-binding domain-containing protein [Nitrospirae bacterium]|nr:LysM peptidoglycan-binding domain-containing protein [Nitrospirota bacterium]